MRQAKAALELAAMDQDPRRRREHILAAIAALQAANIETLTEIADMNKD